MKVLSDRRPAAGHSFKADGGARPAVTVVIGREGGPTAGPTARLGEYRALDGSSGAALHLDVDRPHAGLVVGKRGYGKSHTLGVLAEALARAEGVAPVVVDPMGEFGTLGREATTGDPVPATVHEAPAVDPATLDPRSWCTMLDLDPASGPGSLLWQAAGEAATVPGMHDAIASAEAPTTDRRAAHNHLRLAESWDVFDADGLDAAAVGDGAVSVLDVAGGDAAALRAVLRGVAESLYRARVAGEIDRLPWLLVDEAHTFFEGVARPALELLLTRGRAPGVSLVLATQRPDVAPAVAVSQSDLLLAHRLTDERGLEALAAAQPTYLSGGLVDRLPTAPGELLAVDDATESAHAVRVRERATPHGGTTPRASDER